jgi:hypothetical protein
MNDVLETKALIACEYVGVPAMMMTIDVLATEARALWPGSSNSPV